MWVRSWTDAVAKFETIKTSRSSMPLKDSLYQIDRQFDVQIIQCFQVVKLFFKPVVKWRRVNGSRFINICSWRPVTGVRHLLNFLAPQRLANRHRKWSRLTSWDKIQSRSWVLRLMVSGSEPPSRKAERLVRLVRLVPNPDQLPRQQGWKDQKGHIWAPLFVVTLFFFNELSLCNHSASVLAPNVSSFWLFSFGQTKYLPPCHHKYHVIAFNFVLWYHSIDCRLQSRTFLVAYL